MNCVPEDDLRANIQTVNIKTRTATKVHITRYNSIYYFNSLQSAL